jgi:hypothetical protein
VGIAGPDAHAVDSRKKTIETKRVMKNASLMVGAHGDDGAADCQIRDRREILV